jgi:hypothetical protein
MPRKMKSFRPKTSVIRVQVYASEGCSLVYRVCDMLQKGEEGKRGNGKEVKKALVLSLVIYHLRFNSSHLGTRRGCPKDK